MQHRILSSASVLTVEYIKSRTLVLIKVHECESITFPLISTGNYGFSKAHGRSYDIFSFTFEGKEYSFVRYTGDAEKVHCIFLDCPTE